MSNETYLGDGLYAAFDGHNVRLRAPRENGDHIVVLEPEVYRALLSFLGTVEVEDDERGLNVM
jgi:hypothetical protein